MPLKTRTSPIALAAAITLAVTSTAFAETMVGGQLVNDTDLPKVSAHCTSLTGDTSAAYGNPNIDRDKTTAVPRSNSGTPDTPATDDGPATLEMDASSKKNDTENTMPKDYGADDRTLDLTAITAQDCAAAGM